MHGGALPKNFKRPQTAATTTKKDESRIKKKLEILEKIERKIEDDIEEFNQKKDINKKDKGIRVTKQLLLDYTTCDKLSEIQTVINIVKFLGNFERQVDRDI